MNSISKRAWRFLSLRKIRSDDFIHIIQGLDKLYFSGIDEDILLMNKFLDNKNHAIRLRTIHTCKSIINRSELQMDLIDQLNGLYSSFSLKGKISLIEIFQILDLEKRESLLMKHILDAESDILYSLIKALSGSKKEEIMDRFLYATNTFDHVIRRIAYESWFESISLMEFEERVDYTSGYAHQLIRATYEMEDNGDLLKEMLMHVSKSSLAQPKAYPEFILRYLIELVNKWEYDPDVYRNLHGLMVPAYFTFETDITDKERSYIIV